MSLKQYRAFYIFFFARLILWPLVSRSMSCVDSVVTCCRCPRNVKRLGWDTWMRRRSTAKSKSIPCRPIQTPETSCIFMSVIFMSVNFMPGHFDGPLFSCPSCSAPRAPAQCTCLRGLTSVTDAVQCRALGRRRKPLWSLRRRLAALVHSSTTHRHSPCQQLSYCVRCYFAYAYIHFGFFYLMQIR